MAYEPDIAAVAPTLELTLDFVEGSLRCAGTLDARARRQVVEAVSELLAHAPTCVTVDVSALYVADVDAADILAGVQKMARDARVRLRWDGLDSEHLRGILPVRYRARRPDRSRSCRPAVFSGERPRR